ncbi:hypothetical protein HRI_000764700 [Hibiscus trionum]|uniref:ENTH domain-containing protein n=1 Tax=Hibiscus trionum TaxID=183268 RepID=A0A9W7LNF1_HIBTR|nr:hypothetical protein HRI_000764700 [Hibiscus trionum]
MPSKLKKAIGAVKDRTSISLAKVVNTNSATLEVAVLKATTHDHSPIDERHVQDILQTVSSNRLFARIAARSIAKRLGKTKSWVVVLKCLMLVLRIVQDGDPYFPKEVLHAMNRKARTLNLPTFRDDSGPIPCDYTAFVKSFASYIEERLDCFLTGKLQKRFTFREKQLSGHLRSRRVNQQSVQHMKPSMLLDRISYWQRLLDKAIATIPTGSAKTNRLVLLSFYAVVRESFDLYRDISNGLGLVLDSFFHLQHKSCVSTIEYCVKAGKQFEHLSSFYESCKRMEVGRTSDYPSVHGISEELLETLKEFVKDQASFPSTRKSPSSKSPLLLRLVSTAAKDLSVSEGEPEAAPSPRTSRGSAATLEDLMKQEEEGEEEESVAALRASFSIANFSELSRKQFDEQEVSYNNVAETGSNHSLPIGQDQNVNIDFISFDEWPNVENNNKALVQQSSETSSYSANAEKGCCRELALIEVAASQNLANYQSFFDNRTKQASQNGASGVSFSNSWFQDHTNYQLGSQNGANDGLFSNSWLQEDQLASQNGATGVSFSNSWLQGDIANDRQASENGANGVSFPNSWLQANHSNEQQASQNGAAGVSLPNSWLQDDHRNDQQASQNGVMGNSYVNDWLLQQQQVEHEQASNDVTSGLWCFDDWLKEDKNLDHASDQLVFNGDVCFDDWLQGNEIIESEKQNQNSAPDWSNNGGSENWELVLVEATTQASQHLFNGIEPSMANHLLDQTPIVPQRQYNPFLEDETDISASIATTTANHNVAGFPDGFSMLPVFQATPTYFTQSSNEIPAPIFQAIPESVPQNPNGTITAAFEHGVTDNPFTPWPTLKAGNNRSVDQQDIFQQQLWLR